MKQLASLPGWPPQGGAGPYDSRKEAFANSPESITLKRVNRVVGSRVDMTCLFGKEVVTFRLFAPDKGTAENIAKLLSFSSGQSFNDLGQLTVVESGWEL